MERVPAYLLVYFWRIRGHSGEKNYLYGRVKPLDVIRAMDEVGMLHELENFYLIALTDKEKDVVFNPLVYRDADGAITHRGGIETRVTVPTSFVTLSRGRHIVSEMVCDSLLWLLTAFLGAFIALLLAHVRP